MLRCSFFGAQAGPFELALVSISAVTRDGGSRG